MDRRGFIAGGIIVALLAAATVAWVVLSPGWAVGALEAAVGQRLGRAFTAAGGARLDLSPLSIRIEGPAIAGASERSDSLVSARALVIPVSLGQIVTRSPDLSALRLEAAEFALLIDERGKASWDFPEARPGHGLRLALEQASFRYFDARNGQALTLSNVDGALEIAADGSVSFRGTAVINSRVARIDLGLRSLARVNADGSPLELAVETDAGSASFSGRLATAKVLSLAGPLSIASREPAAAARWAGLPLPEAAALPGPLNLDGSLDSAGRAYAIRNAAVTLGRFRGAGDIVADLRGERPKLQASLQAETLWLDALVPASGAEPGAWGRAVLPLALLRALDAEVSILARAASYGRFEAEASRFLATVKDGKLEASAAFRLASGGTASVVAKVDSVMLPPAGSLSLKAENAELETLIGGLTGVTALAGPGQLTLELSATGQTQEELVGTLKGTASLSLMGGRLAGIDLGGMLTALRERILDGWSAAPGGTPLDSLEVELALADGLATIVSARVAAPALQLALSGTADLLRRALDVKAEFQPPGTAPLPVPVIVRGNWAAPRIYPDIPDILNNPEAGFARLRGSETPPGN